MIRDCLMLNNKLAGNVHERGEERRGERLRGERERERERREREEREMERGFEKSPSLC